MNNPVAWSFYQSSAPCTVSSLRFQGSEQREGVNDKKLCQWELFWIYTLAALQPLGLNEFEINEFEINVFFFFLLSL